MRRAITSAAAVALLALGPAAATAAAPQKITPAGVGQVKLGMTFSQLRAKHLVGKLHKGQCDAAGPNASPFARLRSPLRGQADFTKSVPHKLTDITIRGGATARGVRVGDSLAKVKAKFPQRKIRHDLGLIFVDIPNTAHIKEQFIVNETTKTVDVIGVPFVAICE
jgi:hypothetical protein